MNRNIGMFMCVMLLALACSLGAAVAATGTWNSVASTDFNDINNWVWTGGAPSLTGPGLNDVVVFGAKGSLVDPVLTSDAYVYGWVINSASNWIFGTLPSSYKLHLGAGGISGTQIESPVPLKRFNLSIDADQTWSGSAGTALSIEGNLSGTGRITKATSAILEFKGDGSGFSGGITVTAGTLKFASTNALGTGATRFTTASATLFNAVAAPTVATPFEFSSPVVVSFAGTNGVTFSGPWTLNSMCNYSGPAGGGTWTHSGPMVGPGGLWNSPSPTVGSSSAGGTLTLGGTGKTFAGPLLVTVSSSSSPAKSLEINSTTVPKSVQVMVPTLTTAVGIFPVNASPLQVGASGTLGSGRVEILAGGLIATAAGNLSSNSSVYIGSTPMQSGLLTVQYNGALPAFDATSVGVVALSSAIFSTSIVASLGDMFLGAAAASTYSGSSLAVGNGSTYRLGGGGASVTLTLDASGTTGALTGDNHLMVGRRGSRVVDTTRSAGINGANGVVSLNDDNTFTGSITVNNNSTLIAVKSATLTTISPLGANGTDKAVTLNGGELKLDNTTGTNGLAVSKGVLTVSGRSLVSMPTFSSKQCTLTFDSLSFDSLNGGALFVGDGSATLLGSKGMIKISSQADTTLVEPRILGGNNADFLAYSSASGFTNVTYVTQVADFTPAGEIVKITNSLAMGAGTLQALHLTSATNAFVVTNSGTLNLTSGGLSLDNELGANTITGGTVHFGNTGDGAVEGFVGIKGGTIPGTSAIKPFNLNTSLDGGAGVTFFSIFNGSGSSSFAVRGLGQPIYLDNAPVNQPISGILKILDNTMVGYGALGTKNFGPGGTNPLFPNISTLLLNGGRFGMFGTTVTIGQNIFLGPNGGVFADNNSAACSLTLNGNLGGPGPFVFDGGSVSAVMNINGTANTNSGDVVIGGGTTTVATNSSLGTGNVQVKMGSGAVKSTLILLADGNLSSSKRLYVDDGSALNNMAYARFRSATPEIGSLAGSGGNVVLGGASSGQHTMLMVGGDNTDTFYAGVIADAAVNTQVGSLIKKGTGTFTLFGANTYSGSTIVSNGTLLVHGSLASSAVTVGASGTLGGLGVINGVVTNNGTLAGGSGTGPGTLSVSNLVFGNNAVLVFALDSATNSSLIRIAGSLTLGATTTLRLANEGLIGNPNRNQDYVLMQYAGSDPELGSWTIDYGTTGWSGARVRLDAATNRIILSFDKSSGSLLMIN